MEKTFRFCVRTREGFRDSQAAGLLSDIADLGVPGVQAVRIARIYYLRGQLTQKQMQTLGQQLLADPITEEFTFQPLSPPPSTLLAPASSLRYTIEVAYRPGVRDPVADSLKKGALDLGIRGITAVHTAQAYLLEGTLTQAGCDRISEKLLINPTVQQAVTPESMEGILSPVRSSPVPIETVHLVEASDTVLQRVSIDHRLSLNLEEMRAIQAYYRRQGREPALIELETLAQTWSEHCKHKTLRGPVVYTETAGGQTHQRTFSDLLKETVMRATQELNRDWCVSVFSDNSGVIRFDDQYHVCMKVETHNHPSALEPFGGASTGIGGVIRDILGTGLGAKPIASTDVFCFAPPDVPVDRVPAGVLHPRRVIKGVVAGVKDYGNKMGIPTVNGAVLFDERFLGNPLVYCGNVGLLPAGKVRKEVHPGMVIVAAGGRTGRDGIHGATFSSIVLDPESETVSSTAVQIGDPITEKKLADVLLLARDRDLFESVTDCGAGGLSSAVGEMAAGCGARVHLEKVPLKYAGLTPTEIWISESQERMVLAVLPEKREPLLNLFRQHAVEASPIGEFTSSGILELFYERKPVGKLSMAFLHEGVPRFARPARWDAPPVSPHRFPEPPDLTETLLQLLSHWDTCSKEWIIRQYDHEVQGGSVLKPMAGVLQESGRLRQGPSDAAVVRPRLDSNRGIVLANGINFRYGRLDPYWMAALCIDEVVRQVVAAGGDPDQLAILDNFCFGDPTRIEILGAIVRASLGCYDAAKAFGTPFISGKDSLYNEYNLPALARPSESLAGGGGKAGAAERTFQIPGTLLISGIGIVPDVTRVLSMEAKRPGSRLYVVGVTRAELGGSSYAHLRQDPGGTVPKVDFEAAPRQLQAISKAIAAGGVLSAHDCSEGGLGVAAAEMAFAGGLGLTLDLRQVPWEGEGRRNDFLLYSESPSRLLLEVAGAEAADFEKRMAGFPAACIGTFEAGDRFRVLGLGGRPVAETTLEELSNAWEAPFRGW